MTETKTTDSKSSGFDWWNGEKPKAGRRLAYDIETNGLLPDVDTIHSLVIMDIDTEEMWSCVAIKDLTSPLYFMYHTIEHGLKLLEGASVVFGHNIISYDGPVLEQLYPTWKRPKQIDTFLLAKMIWPMDALKQMDFPRWRRGENEARRDGTGVNKVLPGQMIGAHRLEAWGYRLGEQKGEYSKTVKALSKEYAKHGDLGRIDQTYHPLATVDDKGNPMLFEWLAWCKPMQDYCEVDVKVTVKLLRLIESHLTGTGKAAKGRAWSPDSVAMEHEVWQLCLDIENRGYGYDLEAAIKLTGEMKTRQKELEDKLTDIFGSWWQPESPIDTGERPKKAYSEKRTDLPDITMKRFSEKTGKELTPYVGPPKCHYSPDAPFVRVKWTKFKPKSRQHLGDRLQKVFGWVPVEYGGAKMDQAKIDETTIKDISEKTLPADIKEMILEYLVVSKTLGQMADGKKSWNDLCAPDGRVHGRIDPLGTVSHRGAHQNPNLGQVPSVSIEETKDAEGQVISKTPITGWKGGFGVECRSKFKPGREGWEQTGTDASGLELRMLGEYLYEYDGGEFATRVSTPGLDIHAENGKITGLSRADTKTTTYAFLYGAGNLKIGLGVGVPEEQWSEMAQSGSARSYVNWARRTFKDFQEPDEKTLAHITRGSEVKKAFLEGISGLKELQESLKSEATEYGTIIALDGRKLSIRKAHATLNQALQGGGAIVCKRWLLFMEKMLQDRGLRPDVDYGLMAWVHDEAQYEHRPGLGPVIAEVSQEAMEATAEYYNFKCALASDSKTGFNWMDCH